MGGTPSPPLTKSPLSFPENLFPKKTKNDVLTENHPAQKPLAEKIR